MSSHTLRATFSCDHRLSRLSWGKWASGKIGGKSRRGEMRRMFWLLISRLNTKTPPGSHPIPTDLQVASPPSQCFIWPILGLGHPMNSPAGYRDGPKHRRQPPAKLVSGNNRGTPNHLLCHSPTREHGGGGIAVLRSGSRHSKGRERRYRLGFDTGSLLLTLCYIFVWSLL